MKKSLLYLLILSSFSFPSIVRNVFIADSATNKNAIVDSTGSLLVVDTTVNSSINSIIDKLIDIETNQTDRSQFSKITDGVQNLDIDADGAAFVRDSDVLTKMVDKNQFTRITDGTDDLSINASGEALVKDTDSYNSLNGIQENQTDKTQWTKITDGTHDLDINASNEALVKDTDAETALNAIQENQTDKTQFTKITDGTHDLDVQTDGSIEVNVRDESGNAFSLTNPLPVEQAYINDPYLTMAAGEKIALSRLFKIENKYGKATDGVQTTATDLWDRADASATQQIWTAPTTARQHNIASTSANDTSGGTGARTIRIWGLQSWSTAESTEDITMNGTSNVATINSYVIIHRMKVLTHGGDDINVGNITATAVTDGTVTAQITASEGQTLMAIYGIPSGKTAYMTCYLVNVHQGATPATAAEVDFTMYINESPDVDETVSGFINKANLGIRTTGNTSPTRCYKPYLKVEGPAIIKFQGIASAADVEGVAEYDLIIINDL